MANTEVDLDDDNNLSHEPYLDALLERVLSVDSLLNNVQELQVFEGFCVSVPSDESN